MIKKYSRFAAIGAALLMGSWCTSAVAEEAPIVTDSRIKTFVYSENEVFKLVMHYGFQSHIIFDKNEVIQTVSVGDSYAWKVTPVENRIFIKPLEESSYTNMTVVSDKRTYQFDLVSKDPKENLEDGLVYMVRFYYPSGNFDAPHLAAQGGMGAPAPMSPVPAMPMPAMAPTPMGGGVPPVASNRAAPAIPYNFNYTLTGPDAMAPERVFDDGIKTYFEFPAGASIPSIAIADSGPEIPLEYTKQDGFTVVNGVAKKFSLRLGNNTVYVYNENI